MLSISNQYYPTARVRYVDDLAEQTLGINYGMSREYAIDLAFIYNDDCSLGIREYANDFCYRHLTG